MTVHLFNPRSKDSWGELANLKHKDYGKVGPVEVPTTLTPPPKQTDEMKQAADPLQKELMETKAKLKALEEEIRKRDGTDTL